MTAVLARITLLFSLLSSPLWPAIPSGPLPPATLHYQAPVAGAQYVNTQTTLGYRLEAALDPATLDEALFEVVGASSGVHAGTAHVASDGRTALFTPDTPFTASEVVTVTVQPGLT